MQVDGEQVYPVKLCPIPNIDDIITVVSGGTHFTKSDLKAAYDQLELDEESKKYTAINTIKFRMTFLQPQPIPHTVGPLDDILLKGSSTEERLQSLEEVLEQF